ncbi:SIS domain-containing protein [Amaricoccus tamworthensis]|uniref:SIS domain-containing protein n=1 Tax=Amaricoccus tamworthensis TaxID=57002 RepID=UPI003C7E5A52
MTQTETQMRREITEIPVAVERLLRDGTEAVDAAVAGLKAADPAFIISVARGSSDHVATYFKYASELLMGVPVASVGPSVASIYKAKLRLAQSACLSISQSGRSPDIVEMTRMAAGSGSLSVAVTNNAGAPLAGAADHVLDLHAGPELSVAATKTFVTSAVAVVWLLAKWRGDRDLLRAVEGLPEVLEKAVQEDWPEFREVAEPVNSLFCLGRGPAYAVSCEAALKFKETCLLHAESYSSAEVLHGPVSIVGDGFPVIGFCARDEAAPALVSVADELADKGGQVFVTSAQAKKATCLTAWRTGHPLTDPISMMSSFYSMVERLAVQRGINPDAPRHLKKVTETV